MSNGSVVFSVGCMVLAARWMFHDIIDCGSPVGHGNRLQYLHKIVNPEI
jgi:hypothetical protein